MGLLTRSSRRASKSVDDTRMTLIEHLEELRRALIVSAAAWLVCSVAAWFFAVDILEFIKQRANLPHLIYLSPTDGFVVRLELAIYAGSLAASPIIFWQVWWFVSAGLHAHEQNIVLPVIVATTVFFLMGVALCFYTLPLIIHTLTGVVSADVMQFVPSAADFLGFLLGLCIAFGLVFELPVVLWTLGMMGIISSGWLWTNRLYWVLGLGLVANFMTPGGDPLITPLVVLVPLLLFYGGSMLVLKISGR